MEEILKNLEIRYTSFISKDERWGFFRGLGNYAEYIFTTPQLKNIVDREFKKRALEYKLIEAYEQNTISEFNEAKNKLFKILKNKNVDVDGFTQHTSFIPNFRDVKNKPNILEQLEMFEDGRISIGGFYSDNLERYLYDITTNLVALGYTNELKDFIVSNQEYASYYNRINDDASGNMMVVGNTNGTFIFSETWPKRFEQVRKTEIARKIESWGSFEAIIKFWKARTLALKGTNSNEILQACVNDKEYPLGAADAVDVLYAAQDFKILMADEKYSMATYGEDSGIYFLRIATFKSFSSTVHGCLIQSILDDNDPKVQGRRRTLTSALHKKKDELRNSIVDDFMERMETFMEKTESFMQESRLAKEAEEIQKQEVIGKWWGGNKPTYNDGVISLGEKTCKILPGAQNQLALCEALFAKPLGAWLQDYEVVHLFKATRGRPFYDTGLKMNKKIEEDLEVFGMIETGMKRMRIKNKLFE